MRYSRVGWLISPSPPAKPRPCTGRRASWRGSPRSLRRWLDRTRARQGPLQGPLTRVVVLRYLTGSSVTSEPWSAGAGAGAAIRGASAAGGGGLIGAGAGAVCPGEGARPQRAAPVPRVREEGASGGFGRIAGPGGVVSDGVHRRQPVFRGVTAFRPMERRRVGGSARRRSGSARPGRDMVAKPTDPTSPAVNEMSIAAKEPASLPTSWPRKGATRAGMLKAATMTCRGGGRKGGAAPGETAPRRHSPLELAPMGL